MSKNKPKIIVILGPTASGKSSLAVTLAKKCKGEIISADSRQVYKGLNIGTGKITKKEMRGVPHHLLNVASPKTVFTVQDFKEQAEQAIAEILSRKKVPIICGGTGFYIQAVVDTISFPDVTANVSLRKKLSRQSPEKLFIMLKKLDPIRANYIDKHNKVRLIRAIEIATKLGSVPHLTSQPKFKALQIGIKTDDVELKQKINKRLSERIKNGMIGEAKKLHTQGVSWKRMNELGLEYRYLAQYLQNQISKEEMIDKLQSEIWKYAKRQRTWFKRDKRIVWFIVNDRKRIESRIKSFLSP